MEVTREEAPVDACAEYLDTLQAATTHSTALPLKKATVTVFTLLGLRKWIIKLLMLLSKTGRRYIITKRGLRGILLDHHINVASWFYEFRMSEKFRMDALSSVTRHVISELVNDLARVSTNDEKAQLMANKYPACYLDFLRTMGRTDEVNALYDGTLTVWNNSWYLHAVLCPAIEKTPKKQIFKTKAINFDSYLYTYTGKRNKENGDACGKGDAVGSFGMSFKGTFYDDKPLLGVLTVPYGLTSGEMKAGEWYGKNTFYDDIGKIYNNIWDGNDRLILKKQIVDPNHAFYSKEGEPIKAMVTNWRDFIE